MDIKNYIRAWAHNIDCKTLKERSFILIGSLVVLWCLWQVIVGFKVDKLIQKISSSTIKINQEISNLQGQIDQISSALKSDPIIKLQQQVKELENTNIKLANKLDSMSDLFTSPQLMTSLLKNILAGANLEIISLKSIPPVPFVASGIEDNKTNKSDYFPETISSTKLKVYKHQIELMLLGSFFQIVDFVARIEQLPHKLLWEELEFVITEYPKAKIKVIVGSLSVEPSLLSIS